jgi:predicted outer membrane protein
MEIVKSFFALLLSLLKKIDEKEDEVTKRIEAESVKASNVQVEAANKALEEVRLKHKAEIENEKASDFSFDDTW